MRLEESWSGFLPLDHPQLAPAPWSLSPATRRVRFILALAVLLGLASVIQALGPWVSEDNDMLAYLGTVIGVSLYFGRGPTWAACFTCLGLLSLGKGHSGFIVTANGLQYLLSFALFGFTTHRVALLADQVRVDAWRSRQRAQILGWLQEFSETCAQETEPEALSAHRDRFLNERLPPQPLAGLPGGLPKDFRDALTMQLSGIAEASLQRIAQTQAQERAAILEATQSLQSTLLNALSHDLQTPLSTIRGTLEVLREPGLDLDEGASRELLEIGYSQANRLLSLVRNMLNLAKLEGGGLKLNFRPLELGELVGSALRHFPPPAIARIRVQAPHPLCSVQGDRTLLTQVLINLIDNGIKYSGDQDTVTISLENRARECRVIIQDQGYGIEPEDQAHIFEKFFRGRTPSQIPGSGLGLHLCRELLALHHGRLEVTSVVGEGSTFVATLPRGDR